MQEKAKTNAGKAGGQQIFKSGAGGVGLEGSVCAIWVFDKDDDERGDDEGAFSVIDIELTYLVCYRSCCRCCC